MITYEKYDEGIHKFFEQAFSIRCNLDSTISELYDADDIIDDALSLCSETEVDTQDRDVLNEIINNRLRCYIERIAIYTRLIKLTYSTPRFDEISEKQEHYCNIYKNVYSHISGNSKIEQSQYQLTVMAYQSLAANYFRRSGMGADKALCQQAIDYIDKAIDLTKGDEGYKVLHTNKSQITAAISQN